MKLGYTITLPPLDNTDVTRRKLHVTKGTQHMDILLDAGEQQVELVGPDNTTLTVALSDITAAGEGPESEAVTIVLDGAALPPLAPGALHASAHRLLADSVPDYPGFVDGTPTPEATPTPEPTPTAEPTPTPSPTPLPSPTPEPSPTPSPTPLPSPTPEPTPEPSPTPLPSPTPTASPTPGASPSPFPPVDPQAIPQQRMRRPGSRF